MKKVSAKKYYEFFDEFIFNKDAIRKIDYPSKNEVVWEYYDSNGKLLSRRIITNGTRNEYFIAE